MADHGSVNSGGAEHSGEPNVVGSVGRNVESADVDASLPGGVERGGVAVGRLLVSYSEALDSIAAKSAIVFLPRRAFSQGRFSRRFLLPSANVMAAILAETHVTSRVDTLLGRGQRFRALNPQGPSLLDLDRLRDFRDSLSPVKRRTLNLWIVLLALAIAFPVAWITDHLRVLAPQVLVCSSRFSIRAAIARFGGTSPGRVTAGCHSHPSDSLVEALVRVAHLNPSPGSVIDAFSSVRASGLVVVLLLAVIWILCVSVVLLAFRSGFRLKRLAFSVEAHAPVRHESLIWSEIRSDGLYLQEREVFTAIGLRCPREFPLDLAVSAGLLVLPLVIAVELLITVTLPKLDLVTSAMLTVGAAALIAAVLLRLYWLVRVWCSRIGLKAIVPAGRWLPDGSTVAIRDSTYLAVLLVAGYIIMEISVVADPGISVPAKIFSGVVLAPVIVWSFSAFWWYRMHRELALYGRYVGLSLVSMPPIFSAIPPLSLAGAMITGFVWNVNTTILPGVAAVVLFIIGFVTMPISTYLMGRGLVKLRLRTTSQREDWKTRATELSAVLLVLVPVPAILYFQHSLNRISLEIAAAARLLSSRESHPRLGPAQ